MKYQRSKRGFTLLEILVVITLILIIAGIALPRFAGVTDEGRKAKAKAELRTIQTALESYLLNISSTVPADWTALEIALENATPRLIGEMSRLYDPFGATATTNYRIERSGNGKYYVLFSIGPNKAAEISGIEPNGDLGGVTSAHFTSVPPTADDVYVTNGQLST